MNTIGSVTSIVRYPVKSMAGVPIDAGFLGFSGLFGDRAYAFVQRDGRKGFPWFTIRDLEDLLLYRPRFLNAEAARAPVDIATSLGLGVGVAQIFPERDSFEVEVQTPQGERFTIDAPVLTTRLEQHSGKELLLRFSERCQSDCRPISLIADGSVAALSDELQAPLDPRRFRANFYVEWDNGTPFYENELIGSILQIGERTRLIVTERDPRCKIVTIDPNTETETRKILRHIIGNHKGTAGVYGAVLLEGMVQVGNPIHLLLSTSYPARAIPWRYKMDRSLPTPCQLEDEAAEAAAIVFDLARRGDARTLEQLLDRGLSCDLQDHKGDSLIMLAAYNGNEAAVDALLRRGADANLANDRAQTPLTAVAFTGHVAIAKQLLAHGARNESPVEGERTALMMAAMFDRIEMLNMLLAHGADPHVRGSDNLSALDLARGMNASGTSAILAAIAAPPTCYR